MAFIKTSELRELENEVTKLRKETLKFMKQKCELDWKLFNTYGRELQKEISDRLSLTAEQSAELGLIFCVEHARIMGVSDDKLIHNREEAEKFFTAGES